jgi:hypothetical protein
MAVPRVRPAEKEHRRVVNYSFDSIGFFRESIFDRSAELSWSEENNVAVFMLFDGPLKWTPDMGPAVKV